jgi:hypothetical protein
VELLIDASAEASLQVELWSTSRLENYVPHVFEVKAEVSVPSGEEQWVRVPLAWKPAQAQNAFIIIKGNPLLTLHMSDRYQYGVIAFKNDSEDNSPIYIDGYLDLISQWGMRNLVRKSICFRSFPETNAFAPERALDGYLRPYGGPHLWSSANIVPGEETYLQLEWDERTVDIREVHLAFNDDVNEDLINLHHHRTPFDTIPELVRDYRLEASVNGQWTVIHRECGNRKRKRVHLLNAPVSGVSALRLVVEATNGAPQAQVHEIRVYE